MPVINNFVTSAVINTPTNMIADNNLYGVVVINNLSGTVDIYVNVDADAASTGTLAGVLIGPKGNAVIPVNGQRVSVASGTASIPVAYYPHID